MRMSCDASATVRLLLVTSAALITATSAHGQSSSQVSAHRCSFGASERYLSIEMTGETDMACSVIYEKRSEGEGPRSIWKSRSDLAFCADKLVVTMDKLRAGGWNCVAMDESSVAPTAGRAPMPAMSDADRVLPPKTARTSSGNR